VKSNNGKGVSLETQTKVKAIRTSVSNIFASIQDHNAAFKNHGFYKPDLVRQKIA